MEKGLRHRRKAWFFPSVYTSASVLLMVKFSSILSSVLYVRVYK